MSKCDWQKTECQKTERQKAESQNKKVTKRHTEVKQNHFNSIK